MRETNANWGGARSAASHCRPTLDYWDPLQNRSRVVKRSEKREESDEEAPLCGTCWRASRGSSPAARSLEHQRPESTTSFRAAGSGIKVLDM